MKQMSKNKLGVTLLEIMLVLAVAAMIIVMSIRYYQSSNVSEQTNVAMQSIEAIASAMDNIANGGAGTYSNITASTLTSVVGSTNMISPTNQPITYTPVSATSYTVSIPLNDASCTSLLAKLQTNAKVSATAACNGGVLSYTYDNTQ